MALQLLNQSVWVNLSVHKGFSSLKLWIGTISMFQSAIVAFPGPIHLVVGIVMMDLVKICVHFKSISLKNLIEIIMNLIL